MKSRKRFRAMKLLSVMVAGDMTVGMVTVSGLSSKLRAIADDQLELKVSLRHLSFNRR
jgi:hypothetical protein